MTPTPPPTDGPKLPNSLYGRLESRGKEIIRWRFSHQDAVADEVGTVIATLPDEEAAALIVRAVNNAHAEILEAAKQAFEYLKAYISSYAAEVEDVLRAAILKAQEGK